MTDSPLTDTQLADDRAIQILSNEGAQCGNCGDQPGDRTCPDCEHCRGRYVAALRKAGWAPQDEHDALIAEVHRLRAELAIARVQAIRDLADKADPQRPEVSFFGDHGRQVGAWMRKQAEYEERRAAASACPGFKPKFQTESDAKRRYPDCKHCGQPRAVHAPTA